MTQDKRPKRRKEETPQSGHEARVCFTVTPPPAKPTLKEMFGAFIQADEDPDKDS